MDGPASVQRDSGGALDQRADRLGLLARDVEVTGDDDRLLELGAALDEAHRAAQLGVGQAQVSREARRMQVGDEEPAPVRQLVLDELADAPLRLPERICFGVSPSRSPRSSQKTFVFSVITLVARTVASGGMRIALPCPANAERNDAVVRRGQAPSEPAGTGSGPTRGRLVRAATAFIPLQSPSRAERPRRDLLQADDVGPVGRDQLDHLAQIRPPAAAGRCCRGTGSRSGPARRSTVGERARRDRRSARLHAVVRPRARGGARAGRRRRRARHVAVPLRGAARPRRLPPRRALLPALRRASSAARAPGCR